MSKCVFCHKRIWFWQHQAYRGKQRAHADCLLEGMQRLSGKMRKLLVTVICNICFSSDVKVFSKDQPNNVESKCLNCGNQVYRGN